MNITLTSEQLHLIIKEEIKKQILEEELIDEGISDYLKSVGFPTAVIGLAAAILIPLKGIVDTDKKERHEATIMNQLENVFDAADEVAVEADFEKFIGASGAKRWTWGQGSQVQHVLEKGDAKVAVLPPGFTVAAAAYMHKKNNQEPFYGLPTKRVNIPGRVMRLDQGYFDNFDSTFPLSMENYMDPFSSLPSDLVTSLPTEADTEGYIPIVMVGWRALSERPDFVLENGKTVKDYYNELYFGKFFSIQDMQQILNSEVVNDDNAYQVSKRLEFLFKEGHPELFRLKKEAEKIASEN
jgi:hypothetical protein